MSQIFCVLILTLVLFITFLTFNEHIVKRFQDVTEYKERRNVECHHNHQVSGKEAN